MTRYSLAFAAALLCAPLSALAENPGNTGDPCQPIPWYDVGVMCAAAEGLPAVSCLSHPGYYLCIDVDVVYGTSICTTVDWTCKPILLVLPRPPAGGGHPNVDPYWFPDSGPYEWPGEGGEWGEDGFGGFGYSTHDDPGHGRLAVAFDGAAVGGVTSLRF